MLDFDYKIYNLSDFLSHEEMIDLENKVTNFDVDLSDVKSSLGFLQWSPTVQEKIKTLYSDRYNEIINQNYLTYSDFRMLADVNDEYGFNDNDYFNFFLTTTNQTFKKVGIYDYFHKTYCGILKNLFNKDVKSEHKHNLIGNINIYPKDSFIRKHQDNDPDGNRLFTILFFINNDRKSDDGSILKIYTENDVIELTSDFKRCVLLEHQNYNYVHEVTKNLIDDVRYSVYSPFTINDYNDKLA